jgi:hypothetical protein
MYIVEVWAGRKVKEMGPWNGRRAGCHHCQITDSLESIYIYIYICRRLRGLSSG